MAYNKIITSEGNVQFQSVDGQIINVHPFHIYTTFNEDTVSFILIAMPKQSGLAIFTSKASDLEVDGTVHTIEQLPNALSEAFAKAGAVARYEIVDELPTSGQSNTIYLVPKSEGIGYDEYIYVNDSWELIGDTDIELDRYVTKEVFSGYTADTLVLINTVSGNVITESERAISAETALQEAINEEVSARTADVEALSGAVDNVQDEVDILSAALEEETSARTDADTALGNKIDGKVVELTQAEYDALQDKDPLVLYVITDAVEVNMNDYYKKTETSGATEIANALNGKADTTDIYTYIDGRGIKVQSASGTRRKSINLNVPIYSGSAMAAVSCNIESGSGNGLNKINGSVSFGAGYELTTNNIDEAAFGYYNKSNGSSTTFTFSSGNTLFSVGNGHSQTGTLQPKKQHNAFEIRQNGDIYIADTNDTTTQYANEKPMIKLQDALGQGGISSGEVQTMIDNSISGKVDTSDFEAYSGTVDSRLAENEEVTAAGLNVLNESKQDTLVSGTNIKTINNESILGSGNIDIQGGGGTVESAITSGSTNAVESKAIWSATTFNKGILLTFNESNSTNYPEGCGKLVVNVGGYGSTTINFKNNEGRYLGSIQIQNYDGINISVDTSGFGGATYEISGTTVILSYPSTGITSVQTYEHRWTYTAVVEGAWVNDNTYMKSEVDAIASGLQNNINSKLDATAYTPTVVDSALNVASTNPIQNQALYSELRIDNGETETTLTFENEASTNYPNGCTKLIVELVGSNNSSSIYFYNGNNILGYINIINHENIGVSAAFDGATYEISGTTVIINYPTVTSVTNISVSTFDSGNYVYKAIVALATPLKNQVVANTTALSSVEDRLSEDEEVTAAGLNAVNDKFDGLQLKKLSQAEFDNLSTKDSQTLYIVTDS